jgi:hypothetical protein
MLSSSEMIGINVIVMDENFVNSLFIILLDDDNTMLSSGWQITLMLSFG